MTDPMDPRPAAQHLGPTLRHLAAVSQTYQATAAEAVDVLRAAAVAEAEHKTAKAKAMLLYKAERERCSIAEAETRADADDRIADLYMQRLTTRAVADSHLERLRQLRMQCEVGRTFNATERDIDRLHAERRGGAA